MSNDEHQSIDIVLQAASILMIRFDVAHPSALRLLMTIAARSDVTVDGLAHRVITSSAHRTAATA